MMAWSGAMRRVAGHVGDLIDKRVLAEMQGKASQFVRKENIPCEFITQLLIDHV